MSKLIVIVGITGNQGGSVAEVFKQEPGWEIRGITRDPDKASSKPLRDAGIELVAADLDHVDSLSRAFKGAHAIYGVTDFWQFMSDPATQEQAKAENVLPNVICQKLEVQQGKNLVDAAATAGPQLERFALSTLSETKKWSKGKYTCNYHFDGKAAFTNYLKETYPELAAKTSYLQVGLYMTNWKLLPVFSPQKQPDGSYAFRMPQVSPGKPLPFNHPPNDTGYFVKALVTKAPAGTNLLGTGDPMMVDEYAKLWGKLNGKKSYFEPMSLEELEAQLPPGLGREIGESCLYQSEFGYDGGDPSVVYPQDIGVEMDKLMTVERYIREEDWSSVLGKESVTA